MVTIIEKSKVQECGSLSEGIALPDKMGHYGRFGGKFVPETIMPALDQLEKAYLKAKDDPSFNTELEYYLKEYVGRPSTLYYAERLTKRLGGAKIYLKREDLNHTGAQKLTTPSGRYCLR